MGIFYYDEMLSSYESDYQWDQALGYLEKLYAERKESKIINALVGFSWFYLIEGSIVSKKSENDQNTMALSIWKKYIDLGTIESSKDPIFNFIAGYTLSLHGFYISEEYEKKGNQFVKTCLYLTKNTLLQQLAENFLNNEYSNKYKPLKNGKEICEQFFNGESLLDHYFNEIFNC